MNLRNRNGIAWPTHKRKASMRKALKLRMKKITKKGNW